MDDVDMGQARDEIGLADAIRAAREAKPAIVATGRCLLCDEILGDEQRWCDSYCQTRYFKERGDEVNNWLNKCHFGDCLETLRRMPDGIVQTCVTSPPYFGLRDYGVAGQIGLETRAPDYVKKLISVFEQVHRVLANDGVLFVNIGDTYAGFKDGKFPPQSQSNGNQRGMPVCGAPHRSKKLLQIDGFKDKELMGIPWRFAFAMQEAGWYLRQEIIWSKPNYTPEKVRDRFVKSHEHIFFFSKQPKYKFNGDAVRVPNATGGTKLRSSVWSVPVSSYAGAHFATFPADLIEPCILGGTDVGEIVLDPFMGSGTTAFVAKQNDRQYIGCELNPAYKDLQDARTCQPSLLLEAA